MGFTARYGKDGAVQPPRLTMPETDTHKYQRGAALVFSGPALATGAARLAAEAALRIGAGLVTVVGERAALEEHAAHVTAIMLREEGQGDTLNDERTRAALIGPGAGQSEQTRSRVERLLAGRCGAVIDAGALTSFADCTDRLFAALHDQCVLTPHDGEFSRLFPDISLDDRAAAAKSAASRAGCTLLLKGPVTHIADEGGQGRYNDHATPWLATAGSGDTLGGIILGLLTQGCAPLDAAAMASWCHGDAGRRGGPGLIADDLSDLLPDMLADLLV